jgi:hypothetical protein
MSDEDELKINPLDACVDRIDADGTNHGVRLTDVKKAIAEVGEYERAKLTGEPDWEGRNVRTLAAETNEATQPMNDAWLQEMGRKYPQYRGMDAHQVAAVDENFARDLEAADEMLRVVREGHCKAIGQHEHKKLKGHVPQAYNKDGTVNEQFSKDAVDYLKDVKGLTAQQAMAAYQYGALGRATEQAKLFAASNAYGRDKRELMRLNDKRENESLTLRDAQRRAALMRKFGK